MQLEELGWTAETAASFASVVAHARAPGRAPLVPGRVVAEHRAGYEVIAASGSLDAEVAGKLRHGSLERPAVGDWVALRAAPDAGRGVIDALLPRRTRLARKAAGTSVSEQVLAANVDAAWLVTSLDGDLNPRRLERYLTVAWESGAAPAIVLTKADACPDRDVLVARAAAVAPGVPVLVVSAVSGEGIEALERELAPGRTVALVGSSGVGKSTLVNRLVGEERQRVSSVGDDGRGRHTTTERRLFLLPGRGLLVDTPGMREVGVRDGAEALESSFAELADLARACRFRDCRHEHEPGCAVLEAVASGALDPERLASYGKLRREISFLERKQDARARAVHGRRVRMLTRDLRAHRLAEED